MTATSPAITSYVAGIATTDITPPVGAPLAGFAARGIHTSTAVYHPLRAVAVSLGDGARDVVLVSVEWLGSYEDLADVLAQEIGARTGLERSHIVINSSHTHCGPAIREADKRFHGWIDEAHRQTMISRVAEVAATAHTHRFPALLHRATGRCTVAVNRRRPDPDDPTRVERDMRPNTAGPVDHDVPVITISSAEDDVVRGVMFGYACHPTSRSGLQIGGDYVGYTYDVLSEALPMAQPMFLQGCGGDQKPQPVDPATDSFGTRSLPQVQQLGDELAGSVVAAVGERVAVTGPLGAAFGSIRLRTEPATVEEVTALRDAPARYRRDWAQRWEARLAAGEPATSAVDLELQVVRIGADILLVAMGAEMTVEHGLRLKREYGGQFAQVQPLGYSNTMIGYVPVARQFDEYGYEVLEANLYDGYSGRFVRETEDEVHAAVAALVAQL